MGHHAQRWTRGRNRALGLLLGPSPGALSWTVVDEMGTGEIEWRGGYNVRGEYFVGRARDLTIGGDWVTGSPAPQQAVTGARVITGFLLFIGHTIEFEVCFSDIVGTPLSYWSVSKLMGGE